MLIIGDYITTLRHFTLKFIQSYSKNSLPLDVNSLNNTAMNDLSETLRQLSALSQDTRLRVFKMLMEATPNGIQAGVISENLNVAPNSLSAHLNILTRSGLITVERQGRKMIYRPSVDAVSNMIASVIEDCCNGHPEVCQSLSNLC